MSIVHTAGAGFEPGLANCGVITIGPLPPPETGESIAFEMLVTALSDRGVCVRTVRLPSKTAERQRILPLILRYLHPFGLFMGVLFSRKKTVYLTIAQSRGGFLRDCFFIWLASLRGDQVIGHLHGGNYQGFYNSAPPMMQRLVRATLSRLHRLIILSDRLRDDFGFEPRLIGKIRVVPNGLSRSLETRSVAKSLPRYPTEPVRLLYLSNLVESKGYMDVLEALALLATRHRIHAVCDFAGSFRCSTDDRQAKDTAGAESIFHATVANLGIVDRVRFHGAVTGAAKTRLLENAHIFVLPTNYCNEGQPVSIIEAMAFGNAVVSTNFRAIPDLVIQGQNGCLVPYHDPEAIAGAIAWIAADPQRYSAMSQASIDRYRNGFTHDAHIGRMLAVLDAESEARDRESNSHD